MRPSVIPAQTWREARDYGLILLGILVYTVSYTCFLLPYQIISGGVSGIATLVYYGTGLHANVTYFAVNALLLVVAARVMGWKYLLKTVLTILVVSSLIGLLQDCLTTREGGRETITRLLGEQKFMSCVIGGLMEGGGLALVFLGGGSTGGTDIIASSINKYWDISLGRVMLLLDIVIVGCSYLITPNVESVVVGYITMLISMNFLDYVINGARQSVQFIIVSERHDEIAAQVSGKLERGVTVLYGEGFYSKEKRQVLLILARKYESRRIFALIRQIDNNAFVSMSNVEGVFGEGFDAIKR